MLDYAIGLSEAYAFLEGLRYGYNAINNTGMTSTEIDAALNYIEADFNTVTLQDIDNTIDLLAAETGLTSIAGQL